MRASIFFLSILSLLFSCADDSDLPGVPGPGGDSLAVQSVFNSLNFIRPVDIQYQGNNLFVVEQRGVVKVFENDPEASQSNELLDIRDRTDSQDNEEGLLGLTFHPDFNQNGYFFVNYTTSNSTTRVSRFEADPQNPQDVPTNSELVILEFDQPFGNHNAGQLAFGPDGYLYVAVGDGGSGGDPQGHGQNTSTLLGNILRIDVDNPEGGNNYGIPTDNPFVGNQTGAREEIFAFGFRNPWRMSFDSETGMLWVGDVGQGAFEEIDVVENGGNYGWRIMEGAECFENNCDPDGLVLPYFSYDRDQGTTVTGGHVYRGSISDLVGWYIYADYGSGRIWALETNSSNPENRLLFDTTHRICSFGVDEQQELYFSSIDGDIFRLVNL